MKNISNELKYWLLALVVAAGIFVVVFPYTQYGGLYYTLNRSEAIIEAKKFLTEKGFILDGYFAETNISSESSISGYIHSTKGSEAFREIMKNDSIPIFGWKVLFFKNLARNIPQTMFQVNLSTTGKLNGYAWGMPDSVSLPVITEEEAVEIAKSDLTNLNISLDGYKITDIKEINQPNRKDYRIRWEKESSIIKGTSKITASVKGNKPAGFDISFNKSGVTDLLLDGKLALLGTISFIFIFLLAQLTIFVFLKKYHEGEVWIKMGRTFVILFYIAGAIELINTWPGMGEGVNIGTTAHLTVKVIILLASLFLVYFFLAITIFTGWTVGESDTRKLWPEKLNGIDAFLNRHIFSRSFGENLFRGLVLAMVIMVVYAFFSIIVIHKSEKIFFTMLGSLKLFNTYVPALYILSNSFVEAALSSTLLCFFVVSFSYSRWKNKNLSIVLSGLAFVLGEIFAVSPVSLNDITLTIVFSGLLGGIYAIILFRFNFLVLLSTQFFISFLSSSIILYSASDFYYSLNFWFLVLFLAVVLGVVITGIIKGEDFKLHDFGLPAHIKRITERERMKKELEIASKVQLSLLPKEQPVIEGYEVAGISLPAKEAGGDFYDFVNYSDNKLGIAIGDVSGKGVGAAIYMTLTKGILQAHAEDNTSPRKVLGKVNKLLYKAIEKNSFVSMFFAILDTNSGELLYSRAGHNPGILCSGKDGSITHLRSNGIALGLEEGKLFTGTLVEDTVKLNKGDLFVLYTDGFTEAMNERLNEYGEKALEEVLKRNIDKSPKDILDAVLHDVNKFTDSFPQHDDMTLVILKRKSE